MEWKHPEEEEADAFLDEAAKQKPVTSSCFFITFFLIKKINCFITFLKKNKKKTNAGSLIVTDTLFRSVLAATIQLLVSRLPLLKPNFSSK
jgi:hypothetical protein